ncbi:helix-turn-helix domain-containing protein [Pseudovibrio sp. JE062]|uniref:winged helix-turn-helix transcriptional regulator n=1 Tax=Pseudovibrio sp. JE062 TaxID=439495 RepID=UPI000186C1BD|nr:helix-turn-helix domain-containing protein [Pseudovibrio sp. JE062]EEA94755.1 cinnamoyl ester hydrolase [Pseudovibrio sp. JE062]
MTSDSTVHIGSVEAVAATVAIIGGKWKPILLYHLVTGSKRFSELKKLMPGASDRMLTRSLRELEEHFIVRREVFAEVPVRVEYSLTKDGMSLIPVLNALSDWGQARNGNSDEAAEPSSIFDALLPTFSG